MSQIYIRELFTFDRAVYSWNLVFERADELTGALLVLVILGDSRWIDVVVGFDRSLGNFLRWHGEMEDV